MKAQKFLSIVGAGALLVSIAGVTAADVRYGESASEWLSESITASTSDAQSIEAINQLNESAPAASGPTGLSVSSVTYGEAGIEWLASASVSESAGLQSIDEVNQLNQAAPAASGKATDSFYSDDFWMAE